MAPWICYFLFESIYLGFGIEGLAYSFWDHVIQISIRQMNLQNIFSQLRKDKICCGIIYSLYNQILIFEEQLYACLCPKLIFMLEIDQTQINNVELFQFVTPEHVFLNFYGAQESIPRNEFH